MVYKKLYSTSTHFYYYYAHRSHIHTFITIINSLHHYTSIPQGHPHLCVSSLEDKCTILWGYEYKLFCSQFSQAALVNLKTFLLLGFVFVYLKTFLLLGYTCVPQDIFNTTTTHRSHNHTFTTTIYSFYHLTSTQCHPLLFVSSLDNKCTNFGVMSANGSAHNLDLLMLLVKEHIRCWGMIHQAERFKIMPFLNHDQSFVSHQCILYELAHMFIFHKNK